MENMDEFKKYFFLYSFDTLNMYSSNFMPVPNVPEKNFPNCSCCFSKDAYFLMNAQLRYEYTFFHKRLVYKKLVLRWPTF